MFARNLVAVLFVAALALLAPVKGFGLKTAAMQLPADFAAEAVRLPVEGYGGANRGRFRIAPYSGEFTRIESRLGIFDPLYASNRGTASFSLIGPEIDGTIQADCRFKQNVATIGIVSFDPRKFGFTCELTGQGSYLPGRLTLSQPRPEGFKQRVLARDARRGIAEFGPAAIEVESVHAYAGSRIQSQTPVGYLLRLDSRVIGALELTDINPTVFLASDLTGEARLMTLLTAISVSLLRDPANSTLGD